ncbi:MAG: hypothetical protein U0746_22240, partial [Gemmataceae bacterium]
MTAYLVRALDWQPAFYASENWVPAVDESRRHLSRADDGKPLGESLRAFTARAAADAFMMRLCHAAWVTANPFEYVADAGAAPRSSLDGPRFHDWLLDCGLPTPPGESEAVESWRAWWDRHAPELSEWQRLRAWEAFDGIKLYDV